MWKSNLSSSIKGETTDLMGKPLKFNKQIWIPTSDKYDTENMKAESKNGLLKVSWQFQLFIISLLHIPCNVTYGVGDIVHGFLVCSQEASSLLAMCSQDRSFRTVISQHRFPI
ncbi:hypothetical protein Tco_0335586 [Tanacetum coccineum]